MGKMNRSFLFGAIVASLTWGISLYLYWIIVNRQDKSTSLFNLKSINDDEHRLNNENRSKKEKIYSQKLIDEMKPIMAISSGGIDESNTIWFSSFLTCFFFCR